MRKIIFLLSAGAMLFSPVLALADHTTDHTIEQLQTQILVLQEKIRVLLQQRQGNAQNQPPGQKDRNLFYSNTVTGDWIKKHYEPVWNAILAKPEHQRVFNNYIQTASYIYLAKPARVFVLGAGNNDVYAFKNIPLSIEKTDIPAFALTDVTFTVEIPEGVKVLRATTGSLVSRVPPQPDDIAGVIDGNTVTWHIPELAMTSAGVCNQRNGCYTFRIETDGGAELTESRVARLKWHVRANGGTQDTEWDQIIGAVQGSSGMSAPNIIMPSGVPAAAPTDANPLVVGSTGVAVAELQESLNNAGFSVPVTQYFGPLTQDAVREVQEAAGIEVTGVVNAETQEALGIGSFSGSSKPKKIPVNQ